MRFNFWVKNGSYIKGWSGSTSLIPIKHQYQCLTTPPSQSLTLSKNSPLCFLNLSSIFLRNSHVSDPVSLTYCVPIWCPPLCVLSLSSSLPNSHISAPPSGWAHTLPPASRIQQWSLCTLYNLEHNNAVVQSNTTTPLYNLEHNNAVVQSSAIKISAKNESAGVVGLLPKAAKSMYFCHRHCCNPLQETVIFIWTDFYIYIYISAVECIEHQMEM